MQVLFISCRLLRPGTLDMQVEWGGGVSVESPHVQRAKYCDLVAADYLQRAAAGRAPPIWDADLAPLLRHCGSLLLDPMSLLQVCCARTESQTANCLSTPVRVGCRSPVRS